MKQLRLSILEWVVLLIIVIAIAASFILIEVQPAAFFTPPEPPEKEKGFAAEDGLVEWITVIGLLLASFTCFSRAFRLHKQKSVFFTIAAILLGLVLFFGAGEEISWGQRILGLRSPDYFQQNNTQGETNFHNLVLGGVKVNLWIFSFLLSFILAVYVIVMPLLYRKKKWMRDFIEWSGIPLPQAYQVMAFMLLFVITQLIPHGKRAEILELGTGLLFFLIIRFPSNAQTFVRR